ncbi:MAG: hypothetical protein KKB20_28355 [Proteobacteria bacterium]|nr:hypothetical protein [Pseudomonadota bacterium]
MSHRFQIKFRQSNGDLYCHPRGVLDGSSAWELIKRIQGKYTGEGNVVIDTGGLSEILPFAAHIVAHRLTGGGLPREHVIVLGEKAPEIAPRGCRVLAGSRAAGCKCQSPGRSCACRGNGPGSCGRVLGAGQGDHNEAVDLPARQRKG